MFVKSINRELLLVILFYLLMSILYFITLVIDTGIFIQYWPVGLNHLLKGLITIPLWLLFFRWWGEVPFWKKLSLHLLTLPLFVAIWIVIYYFLCDYFGFFRLRGQRVIWDIYLTALFYVLQFGNFHLYDYYKRLQKQQLVAAQLGKLNLQSELSALKAQLNPHFLYNVFNTINAAIPNTAKHARDMVNILSDLFRYQLKASREELVRVEEELEFVRKYLSLEQERFGDRLRFNIEVEEEEILQDMMPPILIQPIVENAVKHGISPLIEGGDVVVTVKKKGAVLYLEVSDTGVGVEEEEKRKLMNRGVGLTNTDERLQKMYGQGLSLINNKPQGLIVRFQLPLNHEID